MVIDRMVGKRRIPPGDDAEMVPMFAPAAGHANGDEQR
jgi:hypothetical protein